MRGGRPRQCHLIKAGRPRPKPTVAAQPSVLKLTRLVRFRTSSDDRESVVVDRRAIGLLVGQNRTRCIHGMGCAFSRSGFGRAERGQPALMQCHLRIIAERLNAADAARALRSPPEGNPVPIASAPVTPSPPAKRSGPPIIPSERGRARPAPGALLADRDMAIVRDAIVAAGVAVVSIGIWDLIFWVSSLQFPVE